jgi:hypothetical protein
VSSVASSSAALIIGDDRNNTARHGLPVLNTTTISIGKVTQKKRYGQAL